MKFRFRYLAPDGREALVESLDGLRALMRSGAVGELTLLHDALTREWAPARAHAIYRLMREEILAEAPAPAAEAADPEPAPRVEPLPDLGVSFFFEPPEPEADPERVIRSLLREREQERGPSERVDAFVHPAAWKPAPIAEVPSAAGRSDRATVEPVGPLARGGRALVDPSFLLGAPDPLGTVRLGRLRRWWEDALGELQRQAGRFSPRTLTLMGLLALVLIAVAQRETPEEAAAQPSAVSVVPAPDLSAVVARSSLDRASGFQTVLTGLDSLRRVHDVAVVPKVWLEGAYLADARAYPEVEAYWLRYREFLHDVEARDTALFRGGIVEAAEREGVAESVVSLRLSRAMREFDASQPERAAVYAQMEELASAALALHALLVERADDIDWSPAIQDGVSREPVVEAVARDTVLHDRMWSLLERIFASLDSLGGDLGGSRDNLTDLLLSGIEATSR